MDLFVRLSFPFTEIESFIKQVAEVSQAVVCYQHDIPNNTHIHFYAKHCNKATDTLKLWLKKIVGPIEKTKWSWKEKGVDESCISYMSKGKLKPVFCVGLSDERIEELTQKGYDVKDLQTTKPKKNVVSNADLIDEVFELVLEELKVTEKLTLIQTEYSDVSEAGFDEIKLYEIIIRITIQVHHKHRKGFCEFSIKKIISPVYCKFKVGKKNFTNKISESYFRIYRT